MGGWPPLQFVEWAMRFKSRRVVFCMSVVLFVSMALAWANYLFKLGLFPGFEGVIAGGVTGAAAIFVLLHTDPLKRGD